MSAAAAVWRLARGCALGSLAACSCATPPRREPPAPSALISPSSFTTMSVSFDTLSVKNSFKWGGCGDDVRSASRMAKRFLQGATPLGTGMITKFLHAVNMHNNRAGRRWYLSRTWVADMDKATLEELTFIQLKEHARRYELPAVNDRRKLIASLLTYFENNSQLPELTGQEPTGGASLDLPAERYFSLETIADTMHQCMRQQQQMMK
nr:PREDICTED: protein Wnt-6-like [Linepithema humile]